MQGKLFTSVEAAADFNGLCLIPNTGMIFAANEDTKIQTYYIPVSIFMHLWMYIVMLNMLHMLIEVCRTYDWIAVPLHT